MFIIILKYFIALTFGDPQGHVPCSHLSNANITGVIDGMVFELLSLMTNKELEFIKDSISKIDFISMLKT